MKAMDWNRQLHAHCSMVGLGWAVRQMQDTGLWILVCTIFKYLDSFLDPFYWICLPHIEQTVNNLLGRSLPIRCHASQREETGSS